MAKLTPTDVSSGYGATTIINDNLEDIATAIENTLSRDGTSPNQMEANLDMNSNQILNLAPPTSGNSAARLSDVTAALDVSAAPSSSGNDDKVLVSDGTEIPIWQKIVDANVDTAAGILNTKIKHDITDAETAALVAPTDYSYPPYNVLRYGVTNDGVDCTAALQAVASVLPYLYFPAGTYRITDTITRMSTSRWVGEIPQMLQNGSGSVTPEVVIYGTVADIGAAAPMVRLTVAGVQGSSCHTINIGFKSDKTVNTASLSSMDSSGVNGIDVSSCKNSVVLRSCSFDHMAIPIYQDSADPYYVDQLILDDTHIQQCYLASNAKPTVGINLIMSTIFDCFNFIDSSTDVTALASSLNNSSAASNTTGIKARNIRWIGGWCEGGNNVFRPTKSLLLDGIYASEASAVSGSKFLIGPTEDGVAITIRNVRIPTNTRLISLSGLTLSTISLTVENCYDGTNFSDTASIASYVPGSLDYRGHGNKNATNWNWGWQPGSTYTPTLTIIANADAVTAFSSQYHRNGNVVTVSGKINVDPTAATTLTQVGISLPIASNLANEQDCAGAAAANAVAESGGINADTTNDRAQLNFISAGTTNHTLMYQFTYLVN